MTPTPSPLIDAFAGRSVLVVGEAILDSYLVGQPRKLCQEAPVPVVHLTRRTDAPGGAANTAVNVRALGARVELLSVVGADFEGAMLVQALGRDRVGSEHLLTQPGRRTLAKHRVVAGSQLLVRFDQGHTEPLEARAERRLIDRLADLFPRCDAVIVSDYGYGVVTPRVVAALAELQARNPRVLMVDSKKLPAYRQVDLTAIKPNYEQAVGLLGVDRLDDGPARVQQMATHGQRLLEEIGTQIAAVTLDVAGALVFERGGQGPYRTYARPRPNSSATGAGDTFVSALTLALAAGADVPAAAELAAAAAAVVVDKDGTATCSAAELRRQVTGGDKYLATPAELEAQVEQYRRQGRRIVFTNGCFDIIHRGHIAYLNRAKALGDVLLVGLNSDASVRRLKGPRRPINTLDDRATVLAALSSVDHIAAFDEDRPDRLIRTIRPDVFAKGGDYTRETLPEAGLVESLGGVVQILPYLEDRSTTSIIERIRAAAARPGRLAGRTESETACPTDRPGARRATSSR